MQAKDPLGRFAVCVTGHEPCQILGVLAGRHNTDRRVCLPAIRKCARASGSSVVACLLFHRSGARQSARLRSESYKIVRGCPSAAVGLIQLQKASNLFGAEPGVSDPFGLPDLSKHVLLALPWRRPSLAAHVPAAQSDVKRLIT